MQNKIRQSLVKLEEYAQDKNYSGYDPYDALNSKKLIKTNNKLALIKIDFRSQYITKLKSR